MARFNLEDYETVEDRIKRFYLDNEDGRIVTHNLTTPSDREQKTWIVFAEIFLTAGDQANDLPKATGLAFEIDGTGGANATSALENAETSSIGRALANGNYSGNKRASRTEMQKVASAEPIDFLAKLAELNDIEQIRLTYAQAKAAGVAKEVLDKIKARGESFNSGSKDTGDRTRVSNGSKSGKS